MYDTAIIATRLTTMEHKKRDYRHCSVLLLFYWTKWRARFQ